MNTLNIELLPQQRPHANILSIFENERATPHGFVPVSAPMVRYSKLEFRRLIRQYGVQLAFTPMVIADSFIHSQKARDNEFTTCLEDFPIISQFAARDAYEFSVASQLIYPYVDGVDLNCGCPQSWAISKGYGCGLLRHPELVRDIIQTTRRLLPQSFSISVKLRLLNGVPEESIRSTVELARQLEKCGATFLTIHGRTMWQKTSDPLNIPAMAEVKKSVHIPLVVNGNIRSWQDAQELHDQTKADGVMAARGLLSNPALFDNNIEEKETPIECVQKWLDIATRAGDNIHFQCFHHHLTFMWSSHMKRKLRLEFNNFTKKQQVFDFFEERYGLKPQGTKHSNPFDYTKCVYPPVSYHSTTNTKNVEESFGGQTWNENSNGKYFNEFKEKLSETETRCDSQHEDVALEGSFFTQLD
ncbi:PREDICTED: tRNA-dihydrouridine(20a/20b) synthase [NAD(P)+]-like [Bactrocera latifrons]|uniref:tRNA-dihydrouridine(20a/20b) synthase [NAD(P)+]-like n=1 Tax=Bactrocera latifrons TaxID=174628 RepID=A0A0K8UY66_BACLA|nr:PREDICTED: tRNA-dihydrouridine(20a/20b) synthase [NAD(P)+]-like [Bactrocera latifrons]